MALMGMPGMNVHSNAKYWVNPNVLKGSDSNDGTYTAPFRTLAKAVSKMKAGDAVFIQNGMGTALAEGDIDLTALTDIAIIGLSSPMGGEVIIKPTTDPTTSIFKLSSTSQRILIAGITFNCAGDGGNDVKAINSTGADYVTIQGCTFIYGTGIITTNANTSQFWKISGNRFLNTVNAIVGYLGLADISNNQIIKTATGALTVGISLLDNTTTADSDGALIHHNTILGGIEGTTPLADGILVAAACYGVGVVDNRVAGCTANVTVTSNTAGAQNIFNLTDQGRAGGGEWADAETYLGATA
jgi:hypothetical protein